MKNLSRSGGANVETSVGTGLHESEYELENKAFGQRTHVNGSRVGGGDAAGGGGNEGDGRKGIKVTTAIFRREDSGSGGSQDADGDGDSVRHLV